MRIVRIVTTRGIVWPSVGSPYRTASAADARVRRILRSTLRVFARHQSAHKRFPSVNTNPRKAHRTFLNNFPLRSFVHSCNVAVMLLTDIVIDGIPEVDWTLHVPTMLHILFLGMDHTRPIVRDHCKQLLLNLLVSWSR